MEAVHAALRRHWSPLVVAAGLVVLVAAGLILGGDEMQITLTEMLIRLTIVVGMSIFISNSGILSFGHIGFACIGAYAAGWASANPAWKGISLTGLPAILRDHQYPFLVGVGGGALLAALVACLFGLLIVRISGIAASIASFAFLVIVNNVYSNWDSVTAGSSSLVGIPAVLGPWTALLFALIAIAAAHVFCHSRFGLMLRASRSDEFAARAAAIDIPRMRLAALVASGFFVGMGGSLYGHFFGVLTTDVFYLSLTFITLAMLVVGGIDSLSGAVVGVVAVTVITEILRRFEAGIAIGGQTITAPTGSQEIVLGIVMALILIFRPGGIMQGRDFTFPGQREVAARRFAPGPATGGQASR